jgi:hypothetical protein
MYAGFIAQRGIEQSRKLRQFTVVADPLPTPIIFVVSKAALRVFLPAKAQPAIPR